MLKTPLLTPRSTGGKRPKVSPGLSLSNQRHAELAKHLARSGSGVVPAAVTAHAISFETEVSQDDAGGDSRQLLSLQKSPLLDIIRYNDYCEGVAKSVQAEIQQTQPFGTLEEEALVSLERTADRLQWRLSELLKEHGLSPTQYNALRILRGAKDEGRACSEIGERMINRDPDITRLVDRLERRGLVARSREGHDRRVITTRITPAGLKLLQSLDRPIEEFNRKTLGPLGEQRLRTLVRLLEAVREQTD